MRRDALLAEAQRAGRLPSVVGGVADASGELVWHGAAGVRPGRSSASDLQFRIGSITKTMTAVLLHQAVSEGRLALTDRLRDHVPEASALVFGDRTLRGLLSHTAGLPKEPAGPWWERHDGSDLAALLAANAGVPAMAEEGVEFRYSNLGFGLLGAVAERVLGGSWTDLVSERVLGPLGMRRTTYRPVAPHAQGWSVTHLDARLVPEPHTDTGAMAPAGQLWSTVGDLGRYAGFLLSGHPDVLPLEVLRDAAREVLPGSGYGLGFRVEPGASGAGGTSTAELAAELVGHTGTMPGFMASCFVDRAAGLGYVGMADATTGHDSIGLARRMLAPGEAPVAPSTAPPPWRPQVDVPSEVAAVLGSWWWGQRAFEIRWDRGLDGGAQLELVEVRPQLAYEEYRRRDGRWVGTDGTELEVLRAADGSVDHLVTETYVLTRTPGAR